MRVTAILETRLSDFEAYLIEGIIIRAAEATLLLCLSPKTLGGSVPAWGTADFFISPFENSENQLLQRPTVPKSASDSTFHEVHYNTNKAYSNFLLQDQSLMMWNCEGPLVI